MKRRNSLKRVVKLTTLILISCSVSRAQTANPSSPDLESQVQSIYQIGTQLQDPSVSAKTQRNLVPPLIKALSDPNPAIKHAAAWSLRYAPFGDSGVSRVVQKAVLKILSPKATPDPGTRRYLVSDIGYLTAATEFLVNGTQPSSKSLISYRRLIEQSRQALTRVLEKDPSSCVAEGAVWCLGPVARAGDSQAIQAITKHIDDSRPQVRFAARMVSRIKDPFSDATPNPYKPTVATGSPEKLFAQADSNFFKQLSAAQDTAVNLAQNIARRGYPQIATDAESWGFAPDPQEMVNGMGTGKYYTPQSPDNWQHGFAFPGGPKGWGGMAGGWHAITVRFDSAKLVSTMKIVPHGKINTPAEFRVLAFFRGQWTEVFKTDNNQQCRQQNDKDGCIVTISFRTVRAEQIRFEFNDLSTLVPWQDPQKQDAHGWFDKIELLYNKSGSPGS
ncbi:MAG: hypothetical protein HY399_04630 [Elusimicrobia bacterium]|nr:hypothetical protein [Elusimicrobiota bacterium]